MRWTAALVVVLAGTAHADAPLDEPTAIDVDRAEAPAGRTELGFDGGAPVEGWGATLAVGWLERPITLHDASGTPTEPVARRQTTTLGGAVALAASVVLDARLGFAHQTGDRLRRLDGSRPLDRWVLDDLRLGARLRVAGTSARAVFVRAELGLPTGDDRDFAGDASWHLAWRLLGRVTLPGDVVIAGSLGVRLRGAEVAVGERVVGDELLAAAGVVVPLPPVRPLWCVADQVKLTAEVVGIAGDDVGGARGPSPVEARLGLVTRPLPAVTFGLRAGAGLVDELGAPRWRVMLELTVHGGSPLLAPRVAAADEALADEALEE